MSKIIIWHEGGVICDVDGIPEGVLLEFRDYNVKGEEDSPNIEKLHYHMDKTIETPVYVQRFNRGGVMPLAYWNQVKDQYGD